MPGIGSREARMQSGLLAYFLDSIHTGLDLLFPPVCPGCGRVDTRWCDHCLADLLAVPQEPHERPGDLDDFHLAATGIHQGKLQQAVQALKYHNTPDLAIPLGNRMAERLAWLEWAIDVIVPVPLHPKRLQTRGYNQAELLANVLAEASGCPCVPEALDRLRVTDSQAQLNRENRLVNVRDAFGAVAELVYEKRILLVDDVLTTGATLLACAEAVRDAGANQIYGLTVTVARG